MLGTLGYDSLDDFIDAVVPADRLREPLRVSSVSEQQALEQLRLLAAQTKSPVLPRHGLSRLRRRR